MPKGNPSLRLHRPSGRAVVTLDGKDFYLGPFGSAESREKYHRLMAERAARPTSPTPSETSNKPPTAITVVEVLRAFWDHAQTHYREPTGGPSDELANFRVALRPVRELYGRTPAVEFGPLALRAVRAKMVEAKLARITVNDRVNRIRRVFRWAASVELVPVAVVAALGTVAGLQKGRTTAREPEPVGPVALDVVERTLPHLNRTIAGMVRLQLLTGMRPGEVCALRMADVIQGQPNWTYQPPRHKTAWRGRTRVIPLGPRARALLAEFATDDPAEFVFRPAAAVAEHHAARAARRTSKRTPSERAKRRDRPGADHAVRYDRNTYGNAIDRACRRAFPHPTITAIRPKLRTVAQRAELRTWDKAHAWHPNQHRHAVGTEVRARFGLEAAQTILGHARADVTQLYAERDLGKAHEVAAAIG